MTDDGDERNEVTIYFHKTTLYEKEEYTITLKSKTESINDLLQKAKLTAKDVK